MEKWITLRDRVACLKFRFSYRGKDAHPAVHQELPAVFVDYDLTDLVYYKGDAPWQDKPLTKDRPAWPNNPTRPTNIGRLGGCRRSRRGCVFPGHRPDHRLPPSRSRGTQGRRLFLLCADPHDGDHAGVGVRVSGLPNHRHRGGNALSFQTVGGETPAPRRTGEKVRVGGSF